MCHSLLFPLLSVCLGLNRSCVISISELFRFLMHVRKTKNRSLTEKQQHLLMDVFYRVMSVNFQLWLVLLDKWLIFIFVFTFKSHSNFKIKHNHLRTDPVSVQSHQTLETIKYSWKNKLAVCTCTQKFYSFEFKCNYLFV